MPTTFELKRYARTVLSSTGLQPLWHKRVTPIWERYIELTAPCVFVHIPKTAGTSLAHALGMHGISHSSATEWRDHIGIDRFHSQFRFSIVRHPIDRLISGRLWRLARGVSEEHFARDYARPAAVAMDERTVDALNDELRRLLSDPTWVESRRMRKLLDVDGAIGVDYVGKFEDMESAVAEISRHAPFKRDLPKLKSISKESKQKLSLDYDIMLIFEKKFEEDFSCFGYDPKETVYRRRRREI